ncbi:MAG: tripartite tricarboxylate transporter substrate binding protein [Sulfuriferula multivorans]|uniref:Tripartite tricarboxylate transporter substrate binding protein n=1 Tax=Sulfuriferula multivorans TaxID=1559896 RepID=A0A7C9JZR1_9PROT|nr:tripartite tricarboxylate transporter substrate binding protein [Sulfuriferula multivorans]
MKILSVAFGLVALGSAQSTLAQNPASDYPNKPVTVIVGFPPGTATDSVGRVLGERLAQRLGKPFIIENKAGQGGSIGAAAAAKAVPDGYTLIISATAPMATNPHLYTNLSYDSLRDFAPIGLHSWLPYALVVNSNSKINTFQDFLAQAKTRPGALNYASIGNGTTTHLLMTMLMQSTDVKLNHIPYKGSAQAQTDLIGGQVDVTFDTMVSVMPHVKSGRLKALAVSTLGRSKYAPEIPTLNELGVTGFDAGAWLGLLAPAGTPKPIVEKLNRELNAILDEPETQKRLLAMGAEILKSTPDQFAAHIKSEHAKWGKLVRETGVKIE